MNLKKKSAIYRSIQELMVNMKKHSNASAVIIEFKQKGKKLNIDYRDNGIGSELTKLVGLQNVENRISSLNGTVTLASELNKGFQVVIAI